MRRGSLRRRDGRAVTLLQPDDLDKWRQMERSLARKIRRMAWTGKLDAPPAQRPQQTASRHTDHHRPHVDAPRPARLYERIRPDERRRG